MTEVQEGIDRILGLLSTEIDISPTDYQRAVDSYNAVGNWLIGGFHEGKFPLCQTEPEIYPQGSFRLGTVVRPLKDGKESDFDIDLVCQAGYDSSVVPRVVKQNVGSRLKENSTYREKLDDEGRRCWTLQYESAGKTPFHMDVLPCMDMTHPTRITITDKDKKTGAYSWKSSDPRGFAEWFTSRNTVFANFSSIQKRKLFESTRNSDGSQFFASVDAVPNELVRTPLQRTIQLLKRHRDIQYKTHPEHKPISMIISTLIGQAYTGEASILEALQNAVDTIYAYSAYIEERSGKWILTESMKRQSLISRRQNPSGYWEWYIPNPVNSAENFADKWHEDNNARAIEFFSWIQAIHDDLHAYDQEKGIQKIEERMSKSFGEAAAKRAIAAFGDEEFLKRSEGKLFINTGKGTLGASGAIKVKGHTFYGTEDSEKDH